MGGAIQHSQAFRIRRFVNWFPLGLSYALLYMGRYNLTVSQTVLGNLMPKDAFGTIFGVGAWMYAIAFLLNGPITDRIGGKRGVLIGVFGAAIANLLMGLYIRYAVSLPEGVTISIVPVFTILYALNMYFQSYGAVAIVKVNAHWFHVKERGTFSGIFGIMISTGLFLAFDVSEKILRMVHESGGTASNGVWWVFFAPAILLLTFFVIEIFLLKDKPSQAGFEDFDTQDASSGEADTSPKIFDILKKVLTNKIILIIALTEFCTGVLRNGVMHWFKIFAKEHIKAGDMAGWQFVNDNWGLMLMIAGITGGMIAGVVSDKLFGSRRPPVAAILYGLMFFAVLLMIPYLQNGWVLGALVFVISICVIGTHGVLSGTATMDFGGRKGAATAVGIIDGFVYLGTGFQSLSIGFITMRNWLFWPVFLIPFTLLGIFLLSRIWNATPIKKTSN